MKIVPSSRIRNCHYPRTAMAAEALRGIDRGWWSRMTRATGDMCWVGVGSGGNTVCFHDMVNNPLLPVAVKIENESEIPEAVRFLLGAQKLLS